MSVNKRAGLDQFGRLREVVEDRLCYECDFQRMYCSTKNQIKHFTVIGSGESGGHISGPMKAIIEENLG